MVKVTLKKIASTLGVSTATVSKALKDYPDISEKTKKAVKSLAEKLNYKPNSFAQSLRNQESKIIGLIIPTIVHHFFSHIINGVIDAASENNYLVITLQSNESYEDEKNKINLLLRKNVDGILLSLSDKTVNYKHINRLIDDGVPVVLYDKISKSVNCPKVIINDREAAFNSTQYLIDTGCKRIAHIRGLLKPQTTIDRFWGYKKALEVNNIPFDKNLVYIRNNFSFEEGYNITSKIIEDHDDVDGIITFSDLVATGVSVKLKELGIKVPDQISVMGFGNWFLSQITSPTLSTVDQPGYEMGRKAFTLLFNKLNQIRNGEPINHEIIEIPTKVIPRNSTKAI
ncbi:MAG: LacI family DNA-binding transcriptional regulator [Bacteroidetes bacterium]|nr:LacI family DNA-binding transcriptional regulator [Bacteroidota bacterium]